MLNRVTFDKLPLHSSFFRSTQHFATKLCNCPNFSMLFLAAVIYFFLLPRSKVSLLCKITIYELNHQFVETPRELYNNVGTSVIWLMSKWSQRWRKLKELWEDTPVLLPARPHFLCFFSEVLSEKLENFQ